MQGVVEILRHPSIQSVSFICLCKKNKTESLEFYKYTHKLSCWRKARKQQVSYPYKRIILLLLCQCFSFGHGEETNNGADEKEIKSFPHFKFPLKSTRCFMAGYLEFSLLSSSSSSSSFRIRCFGLSGWLIKCNCHLYHHEFRGFVVR